MHEVPDELSIPILHGQVLIHLQAAPSGERLLAQLRIVALFGVGLPVQVNAALAIAAEMDTTFSSLRSKRSQAGGNRTEISALSV
jgi:hypothetical protein